MFSTRPETLSVSVYVIDVGNVPGANLIENALPQSYTDADFTLLESQYEFVTRFMNGSNSPGNPITLNLTAGDNTGSVHWSNSLEDLPVAYKVTNGQDGTEVHYLQYVVIEQVPTDYKQIDYERIQDTASVIIINELDNIVLPSTGGTSYFFYSILEVLTLFAGMAWLYARFKKRRKGVQSK